MQNISCSKITLDSLTMHMIDGYKTKKHKWENNEGLTSTNR